MSNKRQLTPDGYKRIQREVRKLEEVDLPRVIAHLREIREDNVGNEEDPELHEAMESKKRVEERIAQLHDVLNNAEIIVDNDPTVVNIGDRVVLFDMEYDEELALDLVDGAEVVSGRRGVTADSPLGKALIGTKVDDIVKVKAPDGTLKYKVLSFAPIPN